MKKNRKLTPNPLYKPSSKDSSSKDWFSFQSFGNGQGFDVTNSKDQLIGHFTLTEITHTSSRETQKITVGYIAGAILSLPTHDLDQVAIEISQMLTARELTPEKASTLHRDHLRHLLFANNTTAGTCNLINFIASQMKSNNNQSNPRGIRKITP